MKTKYAFGICLFLVWFSHLYRIYLTSQNSKVFLIIAAIETMVISYVFLVDVK